MVFLVIVLKTQYIFLALGTWECSSVVERSTADREIFFFIIMGSKSKNFRCLKNYFMSKWFA